MIDIQTLKSHASGQWLQIISSLAPQLSPACQRPGQHVKCPCHGSRDGFRLYPDAAQTGGGCCNLQGSFHDGISLLMWVNGWDFKQTVDAISAHLGLADRAIPTIKPIPKPDHIPEKDYSEEREQFESLWNECIPNHPLLKTYLESRGLTSDPPPTLRLHPALHQFKDGGGSRHPAMVGRIERGHDFVGLGIVFLNEDATGKASIKPNKLTWGCAPTITGGSVRLFPAEPGRPLLLCEGAETALAAHEMMGLPVWACLTTSLLKMVEIPEPVTWVVIAGDCDDNEAGQKATEEIASRLHSEGKRVQVCLPPGPVLKDSSRDWLDVLNENLEVAHA